MLDMVEVMEWKTSWEYDSGLVITTWKAVIKKNHVRIQHTVLNLAKLLEGMLTNNNQFLEFYHQQCFFRAKVFSEKDLSKSDLTSRTGFQNEGIVVQTSPALPHIPLSGAGYCRK